MYSIPTYFRGRENLESFSSPLLRFASVSLLTDLVDDLQLSYWLLVFGYKNG